MEEESVFVCKNCGAVLPLSRGPTHMAECPGRTAEPKDGKEEKKP